MKNTLKILWVEDDGKFIDSESFQISRVIQPKYEIDIEVERISLETYDQITKGSLVYDLVLTDLNLDKIKPGLNGTQLIQDIRRYNKFVDILFYSQQANILESNKDILGLGGIFVANKLTFRQQAIGMIEYYIRKIFDLSRTRGEITAVVADFDQQIALILLKVFSLNIRSFEQFKKKMAEDIKGDFKDTKKTKAEAQLASLKLDSPNELINYLILIDSARAKRAIQRIFPYIENKIAGHNKESWEKIITEYETKVLEERNKLAHCKVVQEGGVDILIDTLNGGQKLDYDLKKLISISKDVNYYKNFFQTIYESI